MMLCGRDWAAGETARLACRALGSGRLCQACPRALCPSHGHAGGFPHPGWSPAWATSHYLDAVGSLLEQVGPLMTTDKGLSRRRKANGVTSWANTVGTTQPPPGPGLARYPPLGSCEAAPLLFIEAGAPGRGRPGGHPRGSRSQPGPLPLPAQTLPLLGHFHGPLARGRKQALRPLLF